MNDDVTSATVNYLIDSDEAKFFVELGSLLCLKTIVNYD